MIKITKITWLSKSAKEAEVTLSDAKHELNCFSQPFKEHSMNIELLHTLNADNIIKVEDEESSILNNGGVFEYFLVGKVIDVNTYRVQVGGFTVELDSPLPKDIHEGNYISFTCERIDIWE